LERWPLYTPRSDRHTDDDFSVMKGTNKLAHLCKIASVCTRLSAQPYLWKSERLNNSLANTTPKSDLSSGFMLKHKGRVYNGCPTFSCEDQRFLVFLFRLSEKCCQSVTATDRIVIRYSSVLIGSSGEPKTDTKVWAYTALSGLDDVVTQR
jgi:hypothetical protein